MQDEEVGIARLEPDRDASPAEVIAVRQLLQLLGRTPLAGRAELALRANSKKARHLYLPW